MTRELLIPTIVLALFAAFGSGLLLWVDSGTRDRIVANETAMLKARLNEVLPPDAYNNTLLEDTVEIISPDELGGDAPHTIYLARMDNTPVAAVLTIIAPDGYSGAIKLLVGIYYDGRLAGVRTVSHRETPGLGDGIDTSRSNWILDFSGRSLLNPLSEQWKVKRDGGAFDSFTGATITPRAVVKAVYKSLVYFEREKDNLFGVLTDTQPDNGQYL
jgi:electron transport complex protein RnfG